MCNPIISADNSKAIPFASGPNLGLLGHPVMCKLSMKKSSNFTHEQTLDHMNGEYRVADDGYEHLSYG